MAKSQGAAYDVVVAGGAGGVRRVWTTSSVGRDREDFLIIAVSVLMIGTSIRHRFVGLASLRTASEGGMGMVGQ